MQGDLYYIDRIRFLFRDETGFIANKVNVAELEKYCNTALITTTTKTVSAKTGYRSRLELTVPRGQAFQLLERSLKNVAHKISYIEIARDRLFSTEMIAESKANALMESTHKLYSKKCFIFDLYKSTKFVLRKHGIFSSKTGYFGENSFRYVIYARHSKLMQLPSPCLHDEFRIQSAARIRNMLSINSITDMLNVDEKANFLKLKKKFIRFEELDHEAHGRFRQGMRKGTSSGVMRSGKFVGGKMAPPDRASHLIMRAYDLDSPSQLRIFYKKQRKEAQEKIKKHVTLTPWEIRISKLTDSILNSFFRSIAKPV